MMGILEVLFFLQFLSFMLTAAAGCSISMCSTNSSVVIRFPFRLQGRQPASCGYPGFDVNCDVQGDTILNLPHSRDFFVRDINYVTQHIEVYDPGNCLPRRLLQGLNTSDSPFVTVATQNYIFLSCPSELMSRFTMIRCLSNSSSSVLATASESFAKSLLPSCQIIATLPVPASLPVHYDGFSTDLTGDLQLTWYSPDCQACESKGGMCGYSDTSITSTGVRIGCLNPPTSGGLSKSLQIFRLICLIIIFPALTCAVGIGCFSMFMEFGSRSNRTAVVDTPPQPTTAVGLDESTIESYQKVVLGESRRIPGLNDTVCPICLAEYRSKEVLRCIPECKHCFHADCIDEWLRLKSTCPVCRNSPSPAHAFVRSSDQQ